MPLQLTPPTPATFPNCPSHSTKSLPLSSHLLQRRRRNTLALALAMVSPQRRMAVARASSQQQEQLVEAKGFEAEWGRVSAVLFDMDGVLTNSEVPSGKAAVEVFAELGVSVDPEDFLPFVGTGDANFLGSVASLKGVTDFDREKAKKRFHEIYINKYAKPNSGLGFPGARELVLKCKELGLKVAVASSADRVKVNANLAAAGLPVSLFDAVVSADGFKNIKPAPDIFLAASSMMNVDPSECVVIEDAFAGVQAANAANMRCIGVTTSLSEERLQQAGPTFIRKNIGDISIDDLLYGGRRS